MTDPTPTQPPTVPEGLRHKWLYYAPITSPEREYWLMAQAIAWAWAQREPELQAAEQRGADKELEACCELIEGWGFTWVHELRATRRPSPPTLREQALAVLRKPMTIDRKLTLVLEEVDLLCEALKETPNA